jgi:tripartite-type tricarboxylate transporter receptor subunit TctC
VTTTHMRLHKQVFVLLFAVLACGARAQDYPNRPIRILVPNAPGSSVDTMTRILTTRLGEALGGASIVVEDRDGAGGLIGMDAGRKAAPDGYTLITVSNGSGVIAPLLKKVRPYDTAQDFELIGSFAITPNVLVVNPQLPVNSVKELIDYARAHRATINMASAGIGSQSHLAGALLMTMGNFESLHVPHKGGGPSVGSVAAGQTHWTLTPAPAAMAQVKAGRLRAIGQSLPRRSALLADLPAIAETVPGYDFNGWAGLIAPKGRSSSGCRLRWRRRSRRPRCAMALPARAPISSPAIRRNSASSSRRTWPIPSAS